ncbi:MAG: HAMP domain-containing sensor histidine kinase [Alistipes sp.]
MNLLPRTILSKCWIFLILFCFWGTTVFAENSNKILIISSYGSDYQWSNSIIDGINSKLKTVYPGLELNIEYLSSELFVKQDSWRLRLTTMLDTYQNSPPLVIILVSDEAWLAYNSINTEHFREVPLLLCAVKPHTIDAEEYTAKINTLQLSDFHSTQQRMKKYNATGVLREMNISGYLDLMKRTLPAMDRLALVSDKRFYGVYVRLLFEEEVKKNYADYPVEYLDARFVRTDSLLKQLPKISSQTGLLLTSWLTGEHGFEYSKDYIYKEMSSVLQTPIFITNDIGLDKGYFLGGYFNQGDFWGEKTGDMLLSVISGKSPRNIPPVVCKDDECYMDWQTLHKFDLPTQDLPDTVVYENKPESMFVKYKFQILFIVLIFIVILVAYTYTLRSHLRLQKAQKQTLQAVAEATCANEELQVIRKNLIVALKKAEESDRLKSAFLANMSHEIRTPLNAIVGFSDLIASAENDRERQESADIIKRNSDLLLQLISDILDISKIEAGTLHFVYEDTDPENICHNAIDSLRLKCQPEVTLSLVTPDLHIVAHTDPNRLMQVLVNLIGNAIKFTKHGPIEVGFFAYNEELLEFYVKDSGIGIPATCIDHIFDRFVKLNTYMEGTGLGLAICKTIVETLGGEIGLRSTLGEGSCFWFRIKKKME